MRSMIQESLKEMRDLGGRVKGEAAGSHLRTICEPPKEGMGIGNKVHGLSIDLLCCKEISLQS